MRILLNGRNWTQPPVSTAWQRDRADPPLQPMADEFAGRHGWVARSVALLVFTIFWAAVFAWALA